MDITSLEQQSQQQPGARHAPTHPMHPRPPRQTPLQSTTCHREHLQKRMLMAAEASPFVRALRGCHGFTAVACTSTSTSNKPIHGRHVRPVDPARAHPCCSLPTASLVTATHPWGSIFPSEISLRPRQLGHPTARSQSTSAGHRSHMYLYLHLNLRQGSTRGEYRRASPTNQTSPPLG